MDSLNTPKSSGNSVALQRSVQPLKFNKSPRNGRLPRGEASALQEEQSSEYKARMASARQLLAEDLMKDSPDTLAKLRLRKGLSQTQLAKKIGTSQSHIAKIEAGSVNIFWDTAVRIADALDISLEELRPFIKISINPPRIVAERT